MSVVFLTLLLFVPGYIPDLAGESGRARAQLQDLMFHNGNKLVHSQAQSPWYKMIARYFMHGDKDISIDTARNYFPDQKDDKPAKFIEIAEKDKLFRIESVTKK